MIFAALIWYKQDPKRLRRYVESLAGRADHIVALDGPFAGLANDPCSGDNNYATLYEAAREHNIGINLYHGQVYRSEPDKRNAAVVAAYNLAQALQSFRPAGFTDEDWLLCLDSDEWLLSDIDWDAVRERGYGVCSIWPFLDGKPDKSAQQGARMARLYPLTETLRWGPAHFDIKDADHTYVGWEKSLREDGDAAFRIGHDVDRKIIQDEYDTYNDFWRHRVEGKVMRIVTTYRDSDHVRVRMDEENARRANWYVGRIVRMDKANLGGETTATIVRSAEPALHEGQYVGILDFVCERISEGEALLIEERESAAMQRHVSAMQERAARQVMKRAQKMAKKHKR